MTQQSPLRKFVFWQNYLTFHQAAYMRALAEEPSVSVTWVVDEVLPEQYARLGYPIPDTGKIQVVVQPSDEQIRSLMTADYADAIQVFHGIRGMKLASRAFRISKGYPVKRFLVSENRFQNGWKLPMRWALYTYDALMEGRYIDAILCMGFYGKRGGRSWFSACGFRPERILPFLYCPDAYGEPRAGDSVTSNDTKIIFVGQLVRRKGLDFLLRALREIQDREWSLSVVGTGKAADALVSQARRLGIGSKVFFLGNLPNEAVSDLIARHDLLVLPSRFDGWGVVVNEAILRGVPVVCSDRCGASDLVIGSGFGKVFESGDVNSLREAIDECSRLLRRKDFSAIGLSYRQHILGPATASYVLEVVNWIEGNGRKPRALWLGPSMSPQS